MTEQKQPTLQEVEKKLTETIFNLGRARYERLLAEAREEATAKQASDLAEQAHNLRKKSRLRCSRRWLASPPTSLWCRAEPRRTKVRIPDALARTP